MSLGPKDQRTPGAGGSQSLREAQGRPPSGVMMALVTDDEAEEARARRKYANDRSSFRGEGQVYGVSRNALNVGQNGERDPAGGCADGSL